MTRNKWESIQPGLEALQTEYKEILASWNELEDMAPKIYESKSDKSFRIRLMLLNYNIWSLRKKITSWQRKYEVISNARGNGKRVLESENEMVVYVKETLSHLSQLIVLALLSRQSMQQLEDFLSDISEHSAED
jgi:hypothetical protein